MNKLEEIKDFILSKKIVSEREKLTSSTKLSQDLGLEGGDADEFLQEFSKKFDVDFSGFNFKKYFVEEGWDPFRFIIYATRIIKLKPIILSDLEKAAEEGKWIDPK